MTSIRAIQLVPHILRRDESARRVEEQPEDDRSQTVEPGLRLYRVRHDAAVVAQLMATHLGVPQTRRLRRAEAAEGAAAYRAVRTDIDRNRPGRVALPSWTV